MIGFARALARYATPTSWMKRTGEVETLFLANGLSFPRGESPSPITSIVGSTALSASYERASTCSYAAPASPLPREENCGRQRSAADSARCR